MLEAKAKSFGRCRLADADWVLSGELAQAKGGGLPVGMPGKEALMQVGGGLLSGFWDLGVKGLHGQFSFTDEKSCVP